MYYKKEEGFSMVELMVAMTVFMVAMAASSNIFLSMFTQFKQQSKLAESGMENVIGLEILRSDILHAGDGLPWIVNSGYTREAVGANTAYNDIVSGVPRGFVSGNGAGVFSSSDILVLKGLNVAGNDVAQKWTQLRFGPVTRNWASIEDFNNTDSVVIIDPGASTLNNRILIATTNFGSVGGFAPAEDSWYYIIYGLSETGTWMPFNRADYYISTDSNLIPFHCASGTGILVKAEVSQVDGTLSELPLIDCVADMQVIYRMDLNSDGDFDDANEVVADISGLNAQQIRDQLDEVRVYILVQVGQRDANYTTPSSTIDVGELGFVNTVTLADITSDWENYRWKVETLVVDPYSLW